MSAVGKTLKKVAKKVGGIFTPDIPQPVAKVEPELVIPNAQESETKARKKQARSRARSSGRQSTILTEGLGG